MTVHTITLEQQGVPTQPKRCNRCGSTKPLSEYYRDRRRPDGVTCECKLCTNERGRIYRSEKSDQWKSVNKNAKAKQKQQRRDFLGFLKSEIGCQICGERYPRCLDFHHVDPETKVEMPSQAWRYATERFLAEVQKCIVLCANCHRKVHDGFESDASIPLVSAELVAKARAKFDLKGNTAD